MFEISPAEAAGGGVRLVGTRRREAAMAIKACRAR